MSVRCEIREAVDLPIDVREVSYAAVRELSIKQIEQLPILVGRQPLPLGELFRVKKIKSDTRLEWAGDLHAVHHLGATHKDGELVAEGSVGDCLGWRMRGGRIVVHGNAGHYAGAAMQSGQLWIHGNAMDGVAAAAPTAAWGLRGGTIVVSGNVGDQAAVRMRRGLLVILGDAGVGLARNMRAGTVVLAGRCGHLLGVGMLRGTLLMPSLRSCDLPPTFTYACQSMPVAVSLMVRFLDLLNVSLPTFPETLALHHGDLLTGGRSELWCQGAA